MSEPSAVEKNTMTMNAIIYRAKHVREDLLVALGEETDEQGRLTIMDFVSWTDALLDGVLGNMRSEDIAEDAGIAEQTCVLLSNIHEHLVELESLLEEKAADSEKPA